MSRLFPPLDVPYDAGVSQERIARAAIAASEGAMEQIRQVGEMFAEERAETQLEQANITLQWVEGLADAGTTTWLFSTEQGT
jgi:hypothetical protein